MTIDQLSNQLHEGKTFLCAPRSRCHSQAVKLSLVDKAHITFADAGMIRVASPYHPRFGKRVSSPAKGQTLAQANAHLAG